jgi:penicillin-binding protein 2
MFVAKAGVVAAFSAMATRLGYLQLAKGETYKRQAENNVIRPDELPAARGVIRDRQGRMLAQNRRAWEVRLIKGNLPDEKNNAAERRRVLDTLISALQLEDVLVIKPDAVPVGSQATVYRRVARLMSYDDETAAAQIQSWEDQEESTLILVTKLTIDAAALFREASPNLPGVQVMNEIDYLVENSWADQVPIIVKTDVPREVALKLEANSTYLPGVEIDDSGLAREYLGGEVMSHVLGFVRPIDKASLEDLKNRDANNNKIYSPTDFIGQEGLERALEPDLRGTKGRRSVEVNATGVVMRTIPGSEQEAIPGKNIRLTIDLELQNATAKALEKAIQAAAEGKRKVNDERVKARKKEWKIPNAGSAVAFDPRTGEVLAMVSYPYYDNQLFVTGISSRKWEEYNTPEKGKAFLNRATGELYPPGSTFKIFLAASALHHGSLTPDKTHTCRGAVRVPNTWDLSKGSNHACWVGWNGQEHSGLDLYGAIAQSCDVYFYNVAEEYSKNPEAFDPTFYYDWNLLERKVVSNEKHVFEGLGIDKLAKDMQTRFWFGRPTGIEIQEASGLFPDPEWKLENIGEGWATGDTLNVSIGQGEIQVTPLQLALNTASIATNGVFRKPHLVFDSTGPDGAAEAVKPEEIGKLGIDQAHIDVVREGMRRVCHERGGTAFRRNADDAKTTKWPLTNPEGEEEILIAGKTGTSEFGEPDDLGARDTHAWFTCFAPLDNPEIAVSVVIEAGGEGATYAVPVADEMLRAYFELGGKRKRGKVLSKDPLPIPE